MGTQLGNDISMRNLLDLNTDQTVNSTKTFPSPVFTGTASATALTASGLITYGSLSDGAITITAFVDADNMASDSATLAPTQQSVKAYVDSVASGLEVKNSCKAATTGNITIATALNNGDTLDGVTLADNDRVLVKDQSTASENGIYIVSASPARASDLAAGSDAAGTFTFVEQGTVNGDNGFVCTSNTG